MKVDVAVTGATGRVGGRVARRLAAAGLSQRLLVRDAARAPQLPRTDVATAPYDDPAAVRAALEGVPVVLMVSAAEAEDRLSQHHTFVDAAAAAGVRHLVYTSFFGAAADCTFTLGRDHFATEQRIRDSGMAFTFLRDNFYADFMTQLPGDDSVIRGPAGDGRVSLVAVEDIAAAAAAVLRNPAAHAAASYDLTGPQALSLAEVAEVLTETAGRPVTYQPETVDEAYASRASYGAPQWQLDAWVSTYTAIASGEVAAVSPDVERLVGRPPLSLRDLLDGGLSAY